MQTQSCSNLMDVLRARASSDPEHVVYSFLQEDLSVSENISFKLLDLRARAVAGFLQSSTLPGDRILLVYPFGPKFLEGFFGAIYAGRIPVPAYMPRPRRPNYALKAILTDAQPAVALTTRPQLPQVTQAVAQDSLSSELACFCAEDIPNDAASDWREPNVSSATVAFLQYTSGSTATPRGVIVSHRNIISNEKMIQHAFGETESSIVVSWLPLYHDMGLIGALLQPLWVGSRCFLMSPQTFIQDPYQWLNAISRFHGTTSGGPDFAYRLCTARITSEQLGSLDLSSWKVAFNGSEPVQAATMGQFADKFGPCGFRKSAFVPCYGLAESTLLVTAKRSAEAMVRSFQGPELERNRVVPAGGIEPGKRSLVGCGAGDPSQDIVIVHSESGVPCGPEEIGEIWVSGPHITQGYWNKREESAEVFNKRVSGKEGSYLRTGDLGFMLEDELFITGRSRDLIVLRGRNFYPQDFEMLAAQSHEAFKSGLSAAFAVNTDAEPELVIVQETQDRSLDFEAACQVIREAIVGEFDVSPAKIIFVRAGTLPRTSSGKIRRQECKASFLANELKVVFTETGQRLPEAETTVARRISFDKTEIHDPDFRQTWLSGIIGKILRLETQKVDPEASLLALGLDSIGAAELKAILARDLKVDVPLEAMLQGISLAELSVLIGKQRQVDENDDLADAPAFTTTAATYPLSQGQLAIWYLSRLSPESAAYNISVAVECAQQINEDVLKQSFNVLMQRHEALRTVVRTGVEGPYQAVLEEPTLSFTSEKAEGLSGKFLQELLSKTAEQPFDLELGPLFRISIFQTGPETRVLLFVFHHIIVDFLSLELILSELGAIYQALSRGKSCSFTTKAGRYPDYIEWQRRMLAGKNGLRLKSFWHEQLKGDLPVTELLSSRVRPAVQSYRGASCRFQIDSGVTRVIGEQARALGVSLYSMLLAAFEILIHRYTWQPEITIGTPVSGRLSSRWDQTVGLFINQIVLPAKLSGERKTADFVREVHQKVGLALAHQEYPFSLLVEQLQPRRDPSHSPLFQIMFSFYRAYAPEHKGLEAFLLGMPGVELQFGDLKFRSMTLENKTAQLDLTLSLAEVEGQLCGNLQWNADIFDAEPMSDLAAHYTALLKVIIRNPSTRISDVALLEHGDERLIADPTGPEPDECVQDLIMAQVAASPSATALIAGRERMTYAELSAKATALARHLREQGVGPDVPVAIFASRSVMLLTGMLGTLLAGGAFVPIDPSMPAERARFMISESGARILLSEEKLLSRLPHTAANVICLDQELGDAATFPGSDTGVSRQSLAYILFTSGSTGKPKGVMISHGNLTSFCKSMDQQIACGRGDTFVATTSISFDISMLELLWPLTRGAQVLLLPEQFRFGMTSTGNGKLRKDVDFSLFYFSSMDGSTDGDKYKLMIEGARYGDRHGFCAVWTPERHFHEFGGLFPNPSITSAAIAAVTRRIGIRAGSVVLPLHDPIRVAEEWAVVDNLSKGRVGIAMASGWHADDFAFFPERYEGRKELLYRNLEILQQLWKGEPVLVQSGSGKTIEIRIYPRPIQPVLPVWITAAGTPETFARAGAIGANILTHLLGQSVEKLAVNIRAYRESRQKHGHDPDAGKVTLMLHTFLGEDIQSVRDQVRTPFKNYLKSSVDLIANLIRSEGLNLDLAAMKPKDFDDLLSFAFDRYFETSALFGTARTCEAMVDSVKEIGVNEIGCLIDFGVEPAAALASLNEVAVLMENYSSIHRGSTPAEVLTRDPQSRSILQCTPSMARVLFSDPGNQAFLNRVNTLLLGGESLPVDLAQEIKNISPACKVSNMYGPTETTIWSATHPVEEVNQMVPIGKAIGNTTIYILDNYGQIVPTGMAGEIYIGGNGVARGYLNSPATTAARFVPDPFSARPGMRLYRTGDMGRHRRDGNIEFLGRNDSQVKIRGFRIELPEIEMALAAHSHVRQCVTVVKDTDGVKSLVAYVVADGTRELKADELRRFLKQALPDYMVPSQFIFLNEMPLTTSGKVDRKKLPDAEKLRPLLETRLVSPRDEIEGTVAAIWKRVLRIPELGIDDNFFDLGGHSLLMVQAHREIQEGFETTIPLIKLLEHPTVRSLAVYIRGTAQKDDSGDLEERATRRNMAILLQRQNATRARSTA